MVFYIMALGLLMVSKVKHEKYNDDPTKLCGPLKDQTYLEDYITVYFYLADWSKYLYIIFAQNWMGVMFLVTLQIANA